MAGTRNLVAWYCDSTLFSIALVLCASIKSFIYWSFLRFFNVTMLVLLFNLDIFIGDLVQYIKLNDLFWAFSSFLMCFFGWRSQTSPSTIFLFPIELQNFAMYIFSRQSNNLFFTKQLYLMTMPQTVRCSSLSSTRTKQLQSNRWSL